MNNNDYAIVVENMSKDFKKIYDKPSTLKERLLFWNKKDVEYHHVLKNINLKIKKGETVALIGTNGSGKSTLLKLMTKIIYPNKGEISVQGKLTSLLELGAGFHPDFTGRENIYFNASIFGLTRQSIEKRINDIIEFSELGEFIDAPVRTYSSGMYMRLAFSIAINVDADVLLIDEILGVGDQHFQGKCFAKLEELRDSDKTIVIVSHSLDTIKKLCNRFVWIYHGEVKLDGDGENVVDNYLNQVIEDHRKVVKPFVEKEKYLGQLFIDFPSRDQIYSINDSILFKGWELSETPYSKVILEIDKKTIIEPKRVARRDVLSILGDKFNIGVNEYPGWEYTIQAQELLAGVHDLIVTVYDEKNREIENQHTRFTILP